jgi:CRP-like cAMP-binding protein
MPKRPLSARPPPDRGRPKNKLLAGLPLADFERLQPHLKTVPIAFKQVLHRRNERLRHIFSLNGGVASITTVMNDGAMVEIATVGDEGFLGIGAILGGDTIAGETMTQVPDTNAEAMSIDSFTAEINRRGALHECAQRYSRGLLSLMMQSTACKALHPVHERCCRWLLMTHDRVRSDQFRISHEFLAMMLGSTRPTVTVVAGVLQKAGLIQYTHGRVTILDRRSLEDASCECYGTVKEQFDRLGCRRRELSPRRQYLTRRRSSVASVPIRPPCRT